jgi:ABC-type glycerol-3-phosphate transport system substrate-binding protein
MKFKKLFVVLGLLVIAAMVLTACGGNNTPTDEPMNEEPNEEPMNEEPMDEEPMDEEPMDEEPMDEMMDLSGVTVTFWHVYGEGDPRKETITAIVDDFNATNEYGIVVEELDQGSHSDLQDKINTGLTSGDLPSITQGYTSSFLDWDSVDAVVDLTDFVNDPDYGLTQEEQDAIYPGIFADGLAPDGRRLAWPMSHSANVMTYNYTWAQELGFDAAPTTAAEVKEQVCAAAAANGDGTGGMVWYASASNYLSVAYAFGADELNEDGTAYDFTDQAFVDAALWVADLKANGCAFETESYPNPEQAGRKALITLSSTAGLPYYTAAFEDVGNEDEWGFLPFYGPNGEKATDFFTQSVGVLKSNPEQELASWIFLKFFTNPENQAKWIVASGYLPTQSTTEPLLTDYIASEPKYQSSLDLAGFGVAEPQTFPAWSSVRRAVDDAAALLYDPELTAESAMAILEQLTADAAEYVAEIQ